MIIDFNRYNGGGGSGSGVTPQEVQRQIDSALTYYWESAITESAITEAVSGLATEQYVQDALSGVNLDNYWNSAETQDAISAATSGKADAANVTANTNKTYFPAWNSQGIITGVYKEARDRMAKINGSSFRFYSSEGFDFPAIYSPNSAGNAGEILVSTGGRPVWSAMPAADVTKAYVDSADTALQDQIDTMDDVVAAALVDLNDRVYEISASTPTVDLSNYWTSAQTQDAISAATSGKADAANITANPSRTIFPKWNSQGIITGEYAFANMGDLRVNGTNKQVFFFGTGSKIATFYAPLSAGTAGDILVSTGNGAPVWSAVTMPDMSEYYTSAQTEDAISSALIPYYTSAQTNTAISAATQDMVSSTYISTIWKGTQAQYDAIATKDPETFYIIVNSN